MIELDTNRTIEDAQPGDRVRVIRKDARQRGQEGTVVDVYYSELGRQMAIHTKMPGGETMGWFLTSLELVE